MSPKFGNCSVFPLAEVLQKLVEARQTGLLALSERDHQGWVALENGMILFAQAPPQTGMAALFELVGWREASFEFREESLPGECPRDLAVYEPGVLIAGVAAKADSAPASASV